MHNYRCGTPYQRSSPLPQHVVRRAPPPLPKSGTASTSVTVIGSSIPINHILRKPVQDIIEESIGFSLSATRNKRSSGIALSDGHLLKHDWFSHHGYKITIRNMEWYGLRVSTDQMKWWQTQRIRSKIIIKWCLTGTYNKIELMKIMLSKKKKLLHVRRTIIMYIIEIHFLFNVFCYFYHSVGVLRPYSFLRTKNQ